MKLVQKLLFIFIILIAISCERNPAAIESLKKSASLSEILKRLKINQTDWDTLVVTNDEAMVLSTRKIVYIYFGRKSHTKFIATDSLPAVYIPIDEKYILSFEFIQQVDSTKLFYDFTLRFLLEDSSIIDIDTQAVVCKYPYSSAQLVYYQEYHFYYAIQDFDVSDQGLFLHPFGPEGLYSYNPAYDRYKLLYNYGSGDYIAYGSDYVFFDVLHRYIYRYNLLEDSVDLQIDLSQYRDPSPLSDGIRGLEVYNNNLYILFDTFQLVRFDLSINFIENFYYPLNTKSLTIYDDFAYSVEAFENITAFNLNTAMFENYYIPPSKFTESIKIRSDKLYFSDSQKRFIGFVPLVDFFQTNSISDKRKFIL